MMRYALLGTKVVAAMRALALAAASAASAATEIAQLGRAMRVSLRRRGGLCEVTKVEILAFACPRCFAPRWGSEAHVDGLNRRPAHAGHEDYG